jgi:hypothetical protein
MVFENRVLRRIFGAKGDKVRVTGEWRKFNIEGGASYFVLNTKYR